MNENFGADYVTITDEEGNEFELEHLFTFDADEKTYMAFLPYTENGVKVDEESEDYGIILLRAEEEDGEEFLVLPDTEEEQEQAYNIFMEILQQEEE